jgi:signal transduction histidine kinase
LTLAILPLIVLSLVVGSLLVWYLVTSDTTAGFSMAEIGAILIAVIVAFVTVRSVLLVRGRAQLLVEQVDEMTAAVDRVTSQDLTGLVEALGMPEPSRAKMTPVKLTNGGAVELSSLARSLETLHDSLREVASRQMEALKGGVSSLIVTLARRNASLVDRQLGLLDEVELKEKDPEILGKFYMVDHLATRMRRNAESLLVLAGEPPPRVWPRSMEMADVVRAAVGEIDEYQRIDIVAVETAQLAGGSVADVAHLLAELMENATRFSPPSELVKVASGFDMDGYQLTITDRGVGMTNEKIEHLNDILENPPALGLVLEPTMGIYVVSKLSARHDIHVELIPGIPGLTARVTIPRGLLEVNLKAPPIHWDDHRHVETPTAPRVIDLTDETLVDLVSTDVLPTRSPGAAVQETAPQERSVAQGDSAIAIRGALAAFDRGRQAAEPIVEDEREPEEEIS